MRILFDPLTLTLLASMSEMTFSDDWLELLADPFAVLGIALSADDKSITRHYRQLAKQLHPDRYAQAKPQLQEFVGHVLARLLNPAYGKIRQPRDRAEVLALLRLEVKQRDQAGGFAPTSEVGRLLMQQSDQSAAVFYEQQVLQLAGQQYDSFTQFGHITHQLHELNLIYLHRKVGAVPKAATAQALIKTRALDTFSVSRSGSPMPPSAPLSAQSSPAAPSAPSAVNSTVPAATKDVENEPTRQEGYAQRHYDRAQEYIEKGAYDRAAQEMKDALRLVSDRSDYHALLSQIYLSQKLPGMAAVYCRQALKLNADDALALKLAKRLKIPTQPAPTQQSAPTAKASAKGGLLKSLFRR